MAAVWWWPSLPPWLGSGAAWFVVLNAVVAAIAVLSSRARTGPSLASASPRRGAGVTRRASSAVLQRLRSSSIFSFPSACFPFHRPDAADSQATEEPAEASSPKTPSCAPALAPPPPVPAAEENEDDDDDPNAMSMEDAYALVVAGRHRAEPEREEARRSEVDAQAEEFIRGFKEQRLNSIFNYTQMLKKHALGAGGRSPAVRPDQL